METMLLAGLVVVFAVFGDVLLTGVSESYRHFCVDLVCQGKDWMEYLRMVIIVVSSVLTATFAAPWLPEILIIQLVSWVAAMIVFYKIDIAVDEKSDQTFRAMNKGIQKDLLG